MGQPSDFHDPDQSSLTWLQSWYMSHCDGDWEHGYGISIETLDNPGWTLRFDLAGTPLEGRDFERFDYQRDEHDWLRMWVENGVFCIVCGPLNLSEGLFRFREWVQR
jgi:hypothetical protein